MLTYFSEEVYTKLEVDQKRHLVTAWTCEQTAPLWRLKGTRLQLRGMTVTGGLKRIQPSCSNSEAYVA